MNRRWKLLSIGSLVLALLSFSETAFACACTRPLLPCEAYWQVEAVFIGTAKDLSWIEFEEKLEGLVLKRRRPVFSFSVDKAFRGVNGEQVAVMTEIGGGDCGYDFKIGERYLIYAYRDQRKKEMLSTSVCARTRPVRDADEDLEYIRGVSKASPGGWVYGEVFKSGWTQERPLPIEGVNVTVEGQGNSVILTTDGDGKFHASSLPEGSYKVRVAPPEGFSDRTKEGKVKVADGGCGTVRFGLTVDGRARGRVPAAEGNLLSDSYVMPRSAGAEKRFPGFSDGVTADDEG